MADADSGLLHSSTEVHPMKAKFSKVLLGAAAVATLSLAGGAAEARWGRGGGGPGFGGPGRCGKMLLHAPPEVLKARLSLNDAQLAKLQAVRVNVLTKQIKLKAELDQHRLVMQQLMQQDLPPQAKVLQQMRKARSLRGVLQEERVKAYLKALAVLTTQQRQLVRAQCPWGMGQRWGRGHGWGRGDGCGRGGPGWRGGRGGRGPGGPGGPPQGGPGGGPGW
jgi:Spy/CpxP family protein refolding chaperone